MTNIQDKDFRKRLIDKYLEAKTSLAEEQELAIFYLQASTIDEDERAFAKMIRMQYTSTSLLSEEGVHEYDKIVREAQLKTKRILRKRIAWFGSIAASIALLFVISYKSSFTEPEPNAIEIAQQIQQMMNWRMEDFVSVTVTPIDKNIWVQAELKDGSVQKFILSINKENQTSTLLTLN